MHEAKSTLSALVKRAEGGEEIVIARNGKPVVRLTRLAPSKRRLPWGILHGKMLDNFDEPLDEFKDYV
jgi:prevent-host-death family protein